MTDPIITRDPAQHSEVYTGGDFTGIKTKITMRHGDVPIVVETLWELPEAEYMTAEYWNANKSTIGPGLAYRALNESNVEYAAYQALKTYLEGLPAA